jgi:hypothetical protein
MCVSTNRQNESADNHQPLHCAIASNDRFAGTGKVILVVATEFDFHRRLFSGH